MSKTQETTDKAQGTAQDSESRISGLIVVALDTATDMLACAVGEIDPALQAGDTSAPTGSERALELAATGVRILAADDHKCRRQANVELVSTVDSVLNAAGLTRDDVDAYLVGRGPGSFTGVRIGVATAKGLASGANVALYGVSSLDAVAWTAWQGGVRGLLGVAADAMRREIYPALYQLSDAGVERLYERERVVKAAEAVEQWRAGVQTGELSDLQITGDALVRYGNLFEEAGLTTFVDKDMWWPTGEGLLRAALAHTTCLDDHEINCAKLFETLGTGDPALVLPIYTRLSDAEENERKRLGRSTTKQDEITGVAEEMAGRHLQFRPMGPADAEPAAALEAQAFKGLHHSAWSSQQFLSEFSDKVAVPRTWWVAHDDGELAGFAGGMVVECDLQVLDVAVSSMYRRQGIARRLLAQITYDAQMLGCTTASLEVEASNDAAIALYQNLGFTQVGCRRNYYAPGSDALVMTAELPLKLPVAAESPEPTAAAVRSWPAPVPERSVAERQELERRQLVLAIESSCDETAVAIIDVEGALVANVVSTQIDFHARFGGVVPEIASRKHVEVICGVVDEALHQAASALNLASGAVMPSELAAVGVTQGPGLVGALVVGVAFAKGFAFAANKPLVAVNHLEGHLYANLLAQPDLKPPFIFTLVSGGHTMLVHVRAWGDYQVLGETLDDAVGEAFDKVAKALGLGYPGGPIISRLAETGNPKAIDFPRAMMHSHDYRFSLSGLKTAVVSYIEQETAAGRTLHLPDLAASFEAAVFDVQFKKAWDALKETGAREYCLGGGVAANPHLREMMTEKLGRRGVRVTLPPQNACTDNAAMIAEVARRKFTEQDFAPLTIDADPNMTL